MSAQMSPPPCDRYLSHSIGPACLFGHTHVECPIWFMTPHNHAPHRQNTQSDRMFISFDSHPCDVKHRFHRVRMVASVCPTCTCCGHGCVIISGYPPRVVAAWVTHLGSRCGGVSPTSGITHDVMCRVVPEWHGCKTLSQIVVRSSRHVVAPRMVSDVWHPHRSQVLIILLSGSSVTGSCSTLGGGDVRDLVLRCVSRSSCLVDSEQPVTVHPRR